MSWRPLLQIKSENIFADKFYVIHFIYSLHTENVDFFKQNNVL